MMFSRRVTYSERASSSTRVLLSDGMAAKSKLSRLFTAWNLRFLDPTLYHAPFAVDQLEFG